MVSDEILGKIKITPQQEGLFSQGNTKDQKFEVEEARRLVPFLSTTLNVPQKPAIFPLIALMHYNYGVLLFQESEQSSGRWIRPILKKTNSNCEYQYQSRYQQYCEAFQQNDIEHKQKKLEINFSNSKDQNSSQVSLHNCPTLSYFNTDNDLNAFYSSNINLFLYLPMVVFKNHQHLFLQDKCHALN